MILAAAVDVVSGRTIPLEPYENDHCFWWVLWCMHAVVLGEGIPAIRAGCSLDTVALGPIVSGTKRDLANRAFVAAAQESRLAMGLQLYLDRDEGTDRQSVLYLGEMSSPDKWRRAVPRTLPPIVITSSYSVDGKLAKVFVSVDAQKSKPEVGAVAARGPDDPDSPDGPENTNDTSDAPGNGPDQTIDSYQDKRRVCFVVTFETPTNSLGLDMILLSREGSIYSHLGIGSAARVGGGRVSDDPDADLLAIVILILAVYRNWRREQDTDSCALEADVIKFASGQAVDLDLPGVVREVTEPLFFALDRALATGKQQSSGAKGPEGSLQHTRNTNTSAKTLRGLGPDYKNELDRIVACGVKLLHAQ
jgi:hypothetical protein